VETALQYLLAIDEACAFLQSYVHGRNGYTSGDARAGIARLNSYVAGMQAKYGGSPQRMTDIAREAVKEIIDAAERTLSRHH
jgi:hypothetical protein